MNALTKKQKIRFNPDPNTQAQEVILYHGIKNSSHTPLNFDNNFFK